MSAFRRIVCCGALAAALGPLAASAEVLTPQHAQDELANAQAQYDIAQQQNSDLQKQALLDASNARMIALLQSESIRQRQLSMVSNANALEQIAASLANAARAKGEFNATNALAIAQLRASAMVTRIDAELANAETIAAWDGKPSEASNLEAMASFVHHVADFITGQQAEAEMANARQIGQLEADAIHTPAIAQQQNGIAMGANELLAADTALQAGELNAANVQVGYSAKGAALLAGAAARLQNATVRAGVK